MRLLPAILLTFLLSGSLAAQVTRYDSLARSLLKELTDINTSMSVGSTTEAARAMAARLRAAGFPDSDVVVLENAPKRGNLVVRLRGRDSGKRPILLLSHIDVVEARAEDWTLPPFQFIEKEGVFYGRGVADDKDESAIHLAILMRMKEEGFIPDRDIIAALTTEEEGTTGNGVDWLLTNHRNLIDAEFAFNEGGGGRVRGNGDTVRVSHNVQASEKKYVDFELEVTNPGGHSSVPRDDNAITRLATALARINPRMMPVRLNEVTKAYFSRLADVMEQDDPETASAMRTVARDPDDQQALKHLSADPGYNAQLRTTCVPTMLEGGHAPNALPQRARANVNCRILPDEAYSEVLARLRTAIGDTAVHISTQREPLDSPPSPLTADLMNAVQRISNDMWPGVPVIPTMSTGATDGLYLRNAGIPTYGVSGLFYPETFAHGMNERVPAQAFYEGLEFMYRLVRSVTSAHPIS